MCLYQKKNAVMQLIMSFLCHDILCFQFLGITYLLGGLAIDLSPYATDIGKHLGREYTF